MYREDRCGTARTFLRRAMSEDAYYFAHGWLNLLALIEAEEAAAEQIVPSSIAGVEIHAGHRSLSTHNASSIDDCLREAMDKARTVFHHKHEKPIVVCLVDQDVFPMNNAVGCFVPKTVCDKIFIAVDEGSISRGTLCHEYCHVALFHVSGGAVPRWLDEGLADHFGGCNPITAECPVTSPKMFDTPVTWAEATLTSRAERDHHSLWQAYEICDSFVEFLLRQRGLKPIQSYLRHLSRGLPDVIAFPLAFRRTRTQMENEWRHPMSKPH